MVSSTAPRAARALDRAARAGADALLVSNRANVRYLSGFSGSNGWLLLRSAAPPLLLTDGRYREQAARQAAGFDVRIVDRGLATAVGEPLDGVEVVGFEATDLAFAAASELQERWQAPRWLPTRGLVEELRALKSDDEVERQRRALALTESVLERVAADVQPGTTESGLAARLEYECRLAGAEAMAFPTIVAAGAHGALPHARPRAEPIPPGTPIVIDMGCVLDGYCSDITRCVVLGGPLPERWLPIHEAVSRAREAGIAAIRAGVAARDVDAAARAVLAERGLEEAFVHSLGHGVGLEVHEAPRLAATSDDVLEEGMVVTVEPGVYLPGEGGIRLEDMIRVTAAGAERLNRLDDRPLGAQ